MKNINDTLSSTMDKVSFPYPVPWLSTYGEGVLAPVYVSNPMQLSWMHGACIGFLKELLQRLDWLTLQCCRKRMRLTLLYKSIS